MRSKSGAKKAFRAGFSKGRRFGIHKGSSMSPRQAYHRGFQSGMARMDKQWSKKAAKQADYYYAMGKGSR